MDYIYDANGTKIEIIGGESVEKAIEGLKADIANNEYDSDDLAALKECLADLEEHANKGLYSGIDAEWGTLVFFDSNRKLVE